MTRIRHIDGRLSELAPGSVVEFADTTGALAAVVLQEGDGGVSILTPPDKRFYAHATLTNQRTADVIIHAPKGMR